MHVYISKAVYLCMYIPHMGLDDYDEFFSPFSSAASSQDGDRKKARKSEGRRMRCIQEEDDYVCTYRGSI